MSASSRRDHTMDHVLFDVSEGVATVTLNRPERRNALSMAMGERLYALWETIDADPAIQVAIVTAADCGVFCAGMDLAETTAIQQARGVDEDLRPHAAPRAGERRPGDELRAARQARAQRLDQGRLEAAEVHPRSLASTTISSSSTRLPGPSARSSRLFQRHGQASKKL